MSRRSPAAAVLLAAGLLADAAPPAAAAPAGPEHLRGQEFTLLLPATFTPGVEKIFPFTMKTATIARAGSGTSLDGDPAWRSKGFPAVRACRANTDLTRARKRTGHMRVELFCQPDELYWLFAASEDAAEARALVDELIVPGKPDGAAVQERLRALAAGLVAAADRPASEAGTAAPTVVDYRDARYLVVDLGPHDQVYNTIQVKPAERLARVISDRLLARARLFAAPLAAATSLGGVALETRIRFHNFVRPENGGAGETAVELLVPRDVLRKFADDEITDQELVDASVVRADGNRTAVRLAS